MQGQTEGLPEVNEAVYGALEYRALTNSFVELKHPVGEDMPNGFIKAAHQGVGTWGPPMRVGSISEIVLVTVTLPAR